MDVGARFWSKVAVREAGECWPWKRGKFTTGYGAFQWEGRVQHAPRVAYSLAVGSIPEGLIVMHACDNRLCCNPGHLRLGTPAENSAEGRQSKGDAHYARHSPERLARGSKVGTAKLTEDQVREILTVYASWPKDDRTGKPLRGALQQIADRFKVSRQLIWQIVNGKWWSHVEVR